MFTMTGVSKTSPKVAAKYQPVNGLLIRASYAASFLAPSLKQLFGGQDEGAESTSDPAICAAFPTLSGTCDNFPYKNLTGSNPNLKPETGKTINVGIIIEPTNVVSIGLDFFQIKKKDEISQPSVETAVVNGAIGIKAGEAQVFTNNLNLAQTKVSGVDFDLRLRLGNTPLGKLTVHNSATYYTHIQNRSDPTAPLDEFVGTFLNPRWRNSLSGTLESGPWATTATLRTTAGMRDTTLPGGSQPATTRDIGNHEEVDVRVQFAGVKSLTLTAIVKNLLDRAPPYSNTGAGNKYGSLGFPWIYSPRGRFFGFTANYTFY